jgi:hypothetical protein
MVTADEFDRHMAMVQGQFEHMQRVQKDVQVQDSKVHRELLPMQKELELLDQKLSSARGTKCRLERQLGAVEESIAQMTRQKRILSKRISDTTAEAKRKKTEQLESISSVLFEERPWTERGRARSAPQGPPPPSQAQPVARTDNSQDLRPTDRDPSMVNVAQSSSQSSSSRFWEACRAWSTQRAEPTSPSRRGVPPDGRPQVPYLNTTSLMGEMDGFDVAPFSGSQSARM